MVSNPSVWGWHSQAIDDVVNWWSGAFVDWSTGKLGNQAIWQLGKRMN